MPIDINNLILNNYSTNMSYLHKEHNSIFKKISDLENAIDNGYWKQKYELEYEHDNFDVIELSTNKKLYSGKSSSYSNIARNSINMKTEENCFETFQKQDIESLKIEQYTEKFENSMEGFAKIIELTTLNEKTTISLKKLHKFIFFGTGLGFHIDLIDKKINAEAYFIIEDDLELFRLSLLVTDYKKLSKKAKLFFSIFDDNEEFLEKANEFLSYKFYFNHYIKFFQMLNHSSQKMNDFHIVVSTQPHQRFFYNDLLIQSLYPLNYLQENYKYLTNQSSFLNNCLITKPFILIAAGPSLDKNLAWLKENHDFFIVVTVSATVKSLYENGIHIDIIMHLDGFLKAKTSGGSLKGSLAHFQDFNYQKNLKDAIFICSDKTPKEIVTLFKKENVFLFENSTTYKTNSLKPSAPCVGSISYQILLLLQVQKLYLLGLDLSINSETGKSHFSGHSHIESLDITNKIDNKSDYKQSLFKVDGNKEKKVFTTPHFFTSIDIINKSTKLFKKDTQEIFNLSDGAKFKDIMSIKTLDIQYTNKENNSNNLFQALNASASKILENNDKDNFNNIIYDAQSIRKYFEVLTNKKVTSYDELLNDLEKVYTFIHDDTKSHTDIYKILETYMRYIMSYIFNHYNLNINEYVNCSILHAEFYGYILKIINHYIHTIEKAKAQYGIH